MNLHERPTRERGLPDELAQGALLDPTVPTTMNDGTVVPASVALTAGDPSTAMRVTASEIVEFIRSAGGVSVDVVADYRASTTRPGGLMVRWGHGPGVLEVFHRFGPIPCWLQLRPDHGLDLRFVPRN